MNDWNQLERYRKSGDEEAFAVVVEQHLGLVYHTALRLRGNRAAAEDVVQVVFELLAKKAGKLERRGALASWLYQTTVFTAKKQRTTERRRQNREQRVLAMKEIDSEEVEWESVRPLLDDALAGLGAEDREAVVLRFLEEMPIEEVGEQLGVSRDAARKRCERAAAKLRDWFQKKGVSCTTDALVRSMAIHCVVPLPEELLGQTVQGALSSGGAVFGMAKTGVAAAFMAGVLVPFAPVLNRSPEAEGSALEPAGVASVKHGDNLSGLMKEWKILWEKHGPPEESMDTLWVAIGELQSGYKKSVFEGIARTEWVERGGKPASQIAIGETMDWLHLLIDRDPGAAAEVARNLKKQGSQFYATISSRLPELAIEVPGEIAEFIKLVDPPREAKKRQGISSWSIGRLSGAERDDDLGRGYWIREAVSKLSDDDAEIALGRLEGWAKEQAFAGVSLRKGDGELASSLDYLRSVDGLDPAERGRVVAALLEHWAEHSPAAAMGALEAALRDSSLGDVPVEAGERLVGIAGEDNFEGAVALLGLYPMGTRAEGFSGALARELEIDVGKTLGFILENPQVKDWDSILYCALDTVAPAHAESAWKWLGKQEQTELVCEMRSEVLAVVSERDPKRALEMQIEAPHLYSHSAALDIAEMAVGLRKEGIWEMLAGIPPGDFRDKITLKMLGQLDEVILPRGVILELWASLPRNLQASGASKVVQHWIQSDPEAAREWVAGLPEDGWKKRINHELERRGAEL